MTVKHGMNAVDAYFEGGPDALDFVLEEIKKEKQSKKAAKAAKKKCKWTSKFSNTITLPDTDYYEIEDEE